MGADAGFSYRSTIKAGSMLTPRRSLLANRASPHLESIVNDAIEPADVMTLDGVAALFQKSRHGVLTWVEQGTLPAPLWRRSEIQRAQDNAVEAEAVD
jgi:hypothetical protein